MVPATQAQQQLQKQPTDTAVTTAEEEALRRSTDCVYFLASPLTCKKGSECDYRHSEYARVNPRDCYFWLSGNCLNPKCGFRHPPLDGLLGSQGGASAAGSTTHSSQAAPASSSLSAPHVPYKMGKQAVPCVFFQKGGCMKGDQCAFSHVTKPVSNKSQLPVEATPVPKSRSVSMAFSGLQNRPQGKVVSSGNDSKAGVHLEMRRAPEVKLAPGTGNGRGFEKNVPLHEDSKHVNQQNMTNVLSVAGGIAGHPSQLHQAHAFEDDHKFQNGKDTDDYLRESSPGFDVLVDDELRGSGYYHGEDQYGRREREGKNSLNEYDADFNSHADRELFSEPQGYETYGGMQERQYGWGQQHRASNERMSKREPFPKDESIEESDLRYRLSKQRRVGNGLRSMVNQDHHRHNYSGERNYDRSHRDVAQETYSSRLQGRIRLPGRVNGSDSGSEREITRENYRNRLSPNERQHTSYPGRLRDRITEDRNFGTSRNRREMSDETNRDFIAPKRLAELKGGRDERTSEPFDRKRKSSEERHHKQSETDASFDAPLPLSEILKRKRGSSVHKEEEAPQETKEIDPISVSKNETGIEDKTEIVHDQPSEQTRTLEAANGEEVVVDEEGNEYVGDGEYYEEGYEEDGEYYEEGEHVEGEEEYVEEEYVEEEKDGKDGNDAMLS